MTALVIMLASLVASTQVHGGAIKVLTMIAAIASVVGIVSFLRWAVLHERTKRHTDA